MDRVTTTIVDCSGVGAGGITRMLTEVSKHWPAGHRLWVVAAPQTWQPPGGGADIDVISQQVGSRRKTILGAATAVWRLTGRRSRRSGPARLLSMSPSLAVARSRMPVTTIVHDVPTASWGLSTGVAAADVDLGFEVTV